MAGVCPCFFSATVMSIIAGFSRFENGSLSTPIQRGLITTWILVGTVNGPIAFIMNHFLEVGFVALNKLSRWAFGKSVETG